MFGYMCECSQGAQHFMITKFPDISVIFPGCIGHELTTYDASVNSSS